MRYGERERNGIKFRRKTSVPMANWQWSMPELNVIAFTLPAPHRCLSS
jgi:hypothetical protein